MMSEKIEKNEYFLIFVKSTPLKVAGSLACAMLISDG